MSRGPRGAPPTELEPLIGRFVHEAKRKRADEALKLLQKIASIVKPIMRTRNWFVGTLTEFYPTETNLLGLNINRGQEIRLRLRYPGDANQFLPFEQVVDTMLHELSHIVHGPHDEKFHALWDQLRDEHEALLRKGYTGEGFLGKGSKLGGSGRIPMHEARRKARAAAEKRRTLGAGSGQKLGGSAPLPRNAEEARATIIGAIERRKVIERGCGVGSNEVQIEQTTRPDSKNVVTTRAPKIDVDEETMMKAFIDLIQEEERGLHGDSYLPPSQENPSGMRAVGPNSPLSPNTLRAQQISIEAELKKEKLPPVLLTGTKPQSRPSQASPSQPRPELSASLITTPKPAPLPLIKPNTWTCNICTLVNPIDVRCCDACESARPAELNPTKKEVPNALKPRLKSEDAWARIKAQEDEKNQSKAAAWGCYNCGNFNDQMWWSCERCGSVKTTS